MRFKKEGGFVLFHLAFVFIAFGFLLLILINVDGVKSIFLRASQYTSVNDDPVQRSVFLLVFNPVIESRGSLKLNAIKGWNDPDALTNQLISTFPTVSHGMVSYLVKERLEVDGIPPKPDGFEYTDESYLDCVERRAPCHNPDIIDYQKLFNDYAICSKNVDEVWMWGGPYFGFWEYSPVAYCGKTQFVMGFNYERGFGEAIHDFGHRMEYVGINRVGNGNWAQDETNEWNKFSKIAGHCGNIHYPPGSTVGVDEYNYGNFNYVNTDCDGYLNFPGGPFEIKAINCNSWGCSQEGYISWWLTHIPSSTGTSVGVDGKTIYNNWWKYYIYYDETRPSPSPTPVAGNYSNMRATMPISGNAVFNFDYTGISNHFSVDVSTFPDMSWDTYLTFAQGSGSPMIETNPIKWDKYSCSRTLYWRVRSDNGDQSGITATTVDCSTPSPTPTPTSTPTYTFAPTPTPTLSITPTPIPPVNNSPVISTKFLRPARLGKRYEREIKGYDLDLADKLEFGLSGLPKGLSLGKCETEVDSNKNQLECEIVGRPVSRGIYLVQVVLTDDKFAITTGTLVLLVI